MSGTLYNSVASACAFVARHLFRFDRFTNWMLLTLCALVWVSVAISVFGLVELLKERGMFVVIKCKSPPVVAESCTPIKPLPPLSLPRPN